MNKILIKRRASLGDVLNTTPIVKRLREENPNAKIHIETYHESAYIDNPHIDFLFVGGHANIKDYDRVIDLNLCFESNRRIHQVDTNMLNAFGDTNGDKTIVLKNKEFRIAQEPDWSRTIVVHANRSWPQRTFSEQFWFDIIEGLKSEGFFVITTGMGNDLNPPNANSLINKLTLGEETYLIKKAACFLTGASGLVTVSGATETPVVVLCSMTPWEHFFPYRHGDVGWNMWPITTPLPCYGCDVDEGPSEYYECKYKTNACMSSFDINEIVKTVKMAVKEDLRKHL